MKFFQAVTACVLTVLVAVLCHSPAEATDCNKIRTMMPFNIANYTGLWYEIARYKNSPEKDAYCCTSTVSYNNGRVALRNFEREKSVGGPVKIVTGDGPVDGSTPSKWRVRLAGHDIPIYILDTDYDNYALVFACGKVGIIHFEFGWILARKPFIDAGLKDKLVNEWKTKHGFNPNDFFWTTQSGCTYGL